MKHQALFSSKNISKTNKKKSSAAILLGSLSVNVMLEIKSGQEIQTGLAKHWSGSNFSEIW